MLSILVIGGTGFIGSALARRLSAAGHDLCLPTRHRYRARHLTVLPTVEVLEADVHDPATLRRLMLGRDAVISMVGILRGNFTRAGVPRVVHISSLGAAADATSAYQRSKAAGEAAIRASGLDYTILRPSVVFGQDDHFLNLFAHLQALLPIVPLACPQAQFQPVWVEDVARVVERTLQDHIGVGATYELGGPDVFTLRQLVAYAGAVAGHQAYIVGLPYPLAWLQALCMEVLGGPMTRDNLLSMQRPNVCAESAALPYGLIPSPLEAVVPAYLRDVNVHTDDRRHQAPARR